MSGLTRDESRALAAVDRDALVGALAELVRIPSVTGSAAESDAQRWMAGQLERAGLETDLWSIDLDALRTDPDFPGMEAPRTEALGLVGRWEGAGGPTLVINGHVDVVPAGDLDQWTGRDPFAGRVEAGRVRGRGACDMKGGLLCGLFALRAIRAAGIALRGGVLIESVVGEEDGGLGTLAAIRRGYRGDAAIIPEPTSRTIVPACAGALTFRLVVEGRSAHGSLRREGVSAVEKFWPVFRALEALEERRNREPDPLMARFDPPYPISVGIVRAGDWPSSVPDRLVAEGRLGVAIGESPAEARRALEAAVRDLADVDPWFRDHPVAVEWFGGQFASGGIGADHPLVGLVARAHRELHADEPVIEGAPYGSDLRLLANLAGVPTLHYGPGDIREAHAPDESVSIDELVAATGTLVLAILRFCGVA